MSLYTEEDILERFDLDPEELEVDFEQLDVEWGRQNHLLDKYLKASAYCEKLAQKAHEKVKQIRSDLILEVMKDPEGCIGPKMKATTAAIEAYYRTNDDYLEAKAAMIETEHLRNLIDGQKSKAYGRRKTLEEAGKLSLMGWFSSPLEPRALNELVDKIRDSRMAEANGAVRKAVDESRVRRGSKRIK